MESVTAKVPLGWSSLYDAAGEATVKDRLNFALLQLDRVLGFVPKAEGKVTSILPVAVAMLGIVAFNYPVRTPCSWTGATGGVAAACLVMCLWRIYVTLFPRLEAPRPSPIFFGEIAKLTEDGYVAQVRGLSDEAVIDDAASQTWRNSVIVSMKFAKAKAAFHWLVYAMPFWLAYLALVAVATGKFPSPGGA